MSRITRYVLLQLILTFGLTLVGMTCVLVLSIIAKVGISELLGFEAIFRLLPYVLPRALRFAVPASILMASCSVFGRMSSDNEIVAAKSLGITPRVFLYPVFGLALSVSIAMIWLNDVAITWGASGIQSVIAESAEGVVLRMLKTGRSFRNKYVQINVKGVEGQKLIEPRFEIKKGEPIILHAREAELHTDLAAQSLRVFLTDCTLERGGQLFYANSETHMYEIPLNQATRKDRSGPRVSEIGLTSISKEAVTQQAAIRSMEQQLAARATLQMVVGNFHQLGQAVPQPDGATWNQLHVEYQASKARLNRLHLEPWRRWAEGFSCLFIVMAGAPLAIYMRTTNFFTTFAMCFFPVLCIYYPVLQWAVESAKDGSLPPYAVWLGNGALFIVSGWLTKKVVRY